MHQSENICATHTFAIRNILEGHNLVMSASEVSPPTAETIDVSSHAAASTDILAEGPAKALDPLVSEPSILEKAREMAKPVTSLSVSYHNEVRWSRCRCHRDKRKTELI